MNSLDKVIIILLHENHCFFKFKSHRIFALLKKGNARISFSRGRVSFATDSECFFFQHGKSRNQDFEAVWEEKPLCS